MDSRYWAIIKGAYETSDIWYAKMFGPQTYDMLVDGNRIRNTQ
jgi:hypothetical protein